MRTVGSHLTGSFAYSNTVVIFIKGLDMIAQMTCVKSGNIYISGIGGRREALAIRPLKIDEIRVPALGRPNLGNQ